ncbi:DUF1367 family protein [Escherichia coli]|uniref:DUF1367 family protein n=5 Tax=Enterobacteriaceae TaxID=543 RepID=UPI001354AD42|nr:DUF1367 family protein [Escherichia coli]MWE22378.1 DUF1367 family protein [Escherichia coli]
MAHIQLVKQTSSGLLLPATPESCDFLHQIKIGEWIHADFKRVRNYAFHKRFFKLLQLGFDYWTPVGGAITPRERELLSGFVDYLCESVGREHTPALSDAAEQYLNTVATRRTRDFLGDNGGHASWVKRKAMNSFICSVDRPFSFMGRINEDVNTYTNLGRCGELFMTIGAVQLGQKQTQKNSGGMTELYLDSGTCRRARSISGCAG